MLALGGVSKTVNRLLFCVRYKPELGWLVLARQGSLGIECFNLMAAALAEHPFVLWNFKVPRHGQARLATCG